MTVAYALIRKPITDELLIFEQLLGNRTEFINRFFHLGNPNGYDPSTSLEKEKIIKKAIESLRINIFTSSEFIYDMRYNKSCKGGINGISNHALHIVTNDRNYKTVDQNFNFVFSQKEAIERSFEHYYNLVPYLLIYSVSIIDELVFSLLKDDANQRLKTVKEFRRIIGFILFNEYTGNSDKSKSEAIFKELSKNIVLSCPKCGNENIIERADCELFFESEVFLCTTCFGNLLSTKESIKIIEKAIFGSMN